MAIQLEQKVVAALLVLILFSRLCPVSAVRNAFFPPSVVKPLSQVFFPIMGSDIRFFNYKAFMMALVY